MLIFACLGLAALVSCGDSTRRADAENTSVVTSSGWVAHRVVKPTTKGPGASIPGRPVEWIVVSHPEDNRFRIRTPLVELCPGSRPRIAGVREVDRNRSVVLTAYLVNRVPRAGCGEIATWAEFVVNLRSRRSGLPLYDGSQRPAVRRWPHGEALPHP